MSEHQVSNHLVANDEASCSALADGHELDQEQENAPIVAKFPPMRVTNAVKYPPLFHRDIVCFHEVFEWLSVQDIHSIGQTCNRLKSIANSFFKDYLPAVDLVACPDGCRLIPGGLLNEFSPVAQKVTIEGDDNEPYQYIQSKCKSITRIDFRHAVITEYRAKQIESILNKVEIIHLNNCDVRGDFFDCFLKFCTELKHLIVDDESPENILIGTDNNWLDRHYPTLKHIELNVLFYSKMDEIPELTKFIGCNHHIQSFATDLISLIYLQHALKQSRIRLRDLAVAFDRFCSTYDAIFLLAELHDQHIYNRLHIYDNHTRVYGWNLSMRFFRKILLNRSLCDKVIDLSLKEFDSDEFPSYSRVTDVKKIAGGLLNIERLNMWSIGFNDILLFIQHAPNLKIIAIRYFDGDIIDLSTINKERRKANGAQKVTIYAGEKAFLATKWVKKTINLEFVELRRIDSYEWVHYTTSSLF